MKKIVLLFVISAVFFSCGTYRSFDLNRLTTGMTKEEVIYTVGEPQRVLAVNNTREGYQEVLEYRTSRSEVYALEFWNDYLVGYEFLYDDVSYIAPAPPVILPDYGRPIYVVRPDNRPGRPSHPSRPGNSGGSGRPGNSGRPGQGSSSSGRPGSSVRPDRPAETGRPSTERPATKPTETVRPTTRPVNTGTEGSTRESGTFSESTTSSTRERNQ